MKGHRFQAIKRKFCLLLILGVCGSSIACGGSPQVISDPEEQQYQYSIQIREIPSPDQALYESDILEGHEDCQVLERNRVYQSGSIYRFLAIVNEDENNFYYENVLQIFREETWRWEQIPLSGEGWIEERAISINALAGATKEGAFLRLTDYYAEGGEQGFLGYFDGSEGKLLMEWPKEAEEAFVCQDQKQNIYFVDDFGGTIYAYDKNGKQLRQSSLNAYLRGGICHPVTGAMLWYGNEDDQLRLWEDAGKPSSYELIKVVAPYESLITCGPDGVLYYADAQAVWVSGDTPRQVLNFSDSGYRPQELHSIQLREDGDILCHATLDGTLCLMTLHRLMEGETNEQQEILLYGYGDTFLQQIVTRFNRQNSQYHITIQDPTEDSRAFMEIASGKGPDLFFLSPLEAKEYAREGYIRDMEGIIDDPSLFLNAALENGRVDGVTYGIPYSCTLYSLVFSQKVAGDRQSWTVEEMMKAVRESEAKTLYWYFSQNNAYSIVLQCGLYDNENTAYIDWKAGESHLDEQPFMELLKFAKEYGDNGDYDSAEVLSKLQGGEIAGLELHLWKPGQLDYAETCFAGKASYVGYPTSTGKKGVYVRADCLYVNQATDKLEGIREFMRFMLTKEAQNLCMADGNSFIMPIRLNTIFDLVEQERKKAEEALEPLYYDDGYIVWQEDGLSQEQLGILEELLEQAQPYRFYAMELESILEEELEPYLSGDRSLEETVEILDNRVQVYLDERGTD